MSTVSPTAAVLPDTAQSVLEVERVQFRKRVLQVAGLLLTALGPVFVFSEFGEQGLFHNASLLSLPIVGLLTVWLVRLGRVGAAVGVLFFGVMPAVAWVHVFVARGEMAVMYLVPVLVMGMVVSDRRPAVALAASAAAAALAMRGLRWALGIDTDFGAWLTPSFDAMMVIALTGTLLVMALRRLERNEEILRDALLDRERHALAARHASDEKSAFLARISHELRTPLNAILGYTELIEEEAAQLSQQSSADLLRVHQSAAQLLELIDRVLDLSKVEAGHLDLNLEEVDLAALVDTVCGTVSPLVKRNGNVLVVEYVPCPPVQLDPARVTQVLLNLLSNAARFTNRGTVTLRSRGEPGLHVFEVEDTGRGISPQVLPTLFQPFVQGDPQIARDFGGTGLGLALCDRFVRRMGGHIEVRSIEGEGSVFRVVLPHPGGTARG